MTKRQYEINETVVKIPEALSIYMNQLVYSEKRKGLDVITLSLGEAFLIYRSFHLKIWTLRKAITIPTVRDYLNSV